MDPLVSVIIPTYQGSDRISFTIDSVLRQTYREIQIIVVDDNGLDTVEQKKTLAVLMDYINNGKIKYITHDKNLNGSAARNTGMRASTGKYITFLDDDDVLFPNKIETQVRIFETLDDKYGMVFCSGYIVRDNGVGYKLKMISDDILYNLLVGKLRFNSSMLMIRKSVFDENGGFDESYKRHQDWEFCCRILDRYNCKGINKHLVYKYLTDRNVPSDPDKAERLRLHFLKKNRRIIAGLGMKRKRQVYSFHCRDLALVSIFARQYKRAFKWLCMAGNPFVQFFKLGIYGLKRKTVHREKYAPSLVELQNDDWNYLS